MRQGRTAWRSAPDAKPDMALADLLRWRGVRGGPGDDADRAALAPLAKRDRPGQEREQGVILAAADAGPGVEMGAALAHDDLARVDLLAAEPLDAQSLCVRVAAVPAGRRALLVCHRQPFFRAGALTAPSIPVIRTWV